MDILCFRVYYQSNYIDTKSLDLARALAPDAAVHQSQVACPHF
jgi:hypothetical protein